MSVAGTENLETRPSLKRLAWALLISLAFHVVALVLAPRIYVALSKLPIFSRHRTPPALQAQKPPQPPPQDFPLTFTEVDPLQSVKEAPKNAKYYSAFNSK